TLSDGNGGTSSATVNVLVHAVNDNPVAVDDAKGTNEDAALSSSASALVATDSDADNDPALNTDPAATLHTLIVSAVQSTASTHGTVVLNSNGTITHPPAPSFPTRRSSDLTLSDGNGGTSSATVNVLVHAVNDNPVAVDDAKGTNE